MTALTKFQIDLLVAAALTDNPTYGLAIKRKTEEYREEDEVHHGKLYPNLDTLIEEGLMEKEEFDKRTKVYSLTEDGKLELEQRADLVKKAATQADSNE